MKRIVVLYIIVLFSCFSTSMAQTPGPFYRQFFFNPYLFNPAFVGINNELEANLVYRQQWLDFNDAPVTLGANVQFPTSDRVALGFNIYSDKQALLRNTNFMGTFGYVVPLATNQSLRFGLSAGIGINKLDLTAEELNTNDPAILNAAGNNFYVDGNFGIVYSNGGLRVGFALTDLFKSDPFNSDSFSEFEFSNLKNRLYSISYRFNLDPTGNVSLEPYFLYRQTEDGLQNSWEAASLVHFKDKLWTGASYNQNNGIALFLGMNIKEKFRFSYSYEFPPMNTGFTSSSSHELHVGIKLGEKKKPVHKPSTDWANARNVKPESNENESRSITDNQESMDEPVTAERNKNPETIETENIQIAESVKVKEEPAKETPASKPVESFTMTKGHHYIVVGVFNAMSHSIKFSKEMKAKGITVDVALNPKNNLYYAFINSTLKLEEAQKIKNDYKRKNLFKEAWIFTME